MSGYSQKFYRIVRWPARIVFMLAHPRIRAIGKENLPEGRVLLCGNHSAFSDPIWVVIAGWFDRMPHIMAKKELFKIPVLGRLIGMLGAFPVDRGINDINAVKTAMRILRDDGKLLIFPEGTRVRRGKTAVPHGGALLFAARSGAPIVPVYITTKKRFLAPIDVVFGQPYYPETKGARISVEEIEEQTAELMQKIYALGETL